MDQDEREDIPTASTQYAIQKALEDPIAFAASSNPDILFWDQAMKAHDKEQIHVGSWGRAGRPQKMGNYEPC